MTEAEMNTTLTQTAPSILERARAEYLEMPGLCLTVPQAARLLGVDVRESQRVLSQLESSGLLRRNEKGLYLRRPCPRCS
jgi:predicted transcriptional regulator of viral defense system